MWSGVWLQLYPDQVLTSPRLVKMTKLSMDSSSLSKQGKGHRVRMDRFLFLQGERFKLIRNWGSETICLLK